MAQQPPNDPISVSMAHVRQQRHSSAAGGRDFRDLMNVHIADPTCTNRIRQDPAGKSTNFHNGRRSSDSHTATFGIKMFCKPLCLEMRAHGVNELRADHTTAGESCYRSQDHRSTPEHNVASERAFSNLLLPSSSSTHPYPTLPLQSHLHSKLNYQQLATYISSDKPLPACLPPVRRLSQPSTEHMEVQSSDQLAGKQYLYTQNHQEVAAFCNQHNCPPTDHPSPHPLTPSSAVSTLASSPLPPYSGIPLSPGHTGSFRSQQYKRYSPISRSRPAHSVTPAHHHRLHNDSQQLPPLPTALSCQLKQLQIDHNNLPRIDFGHSCSSAEQVPAPSTSASCSMDDWRQHPANDGSCSSHSTMDSFPQPVQPDDNPGSTGHDGDDGSVNMLDKPPQQLSQPQRRSGVFMASHPFMDMEASCNGGAYQETPVTGGTLQTCSAQSDCTRYTHFLIPTAVDDHALGDVSWRPRPSTSLVLSAADSGGFSFTMTGDCLRAPRMPSSDTLTSPAGSVDWAAHGPPVEFAGDATGIPLELGYGNGAPQGSAEANRLPCAAADVPAPLDTHCGISWSPCAPSWNRGSPGHDLPTDDAAVDVGPYDATRSPPDVVTDRRNRPFPHTQCDRTLQACQEDRCYRGECHLPADQKNVITHRPDDRLPTPLSAAGFPCSPICDLLPRDINPRISRNLSHQNDFSTLRSSGVTDHLLNGAHVDGAAAEPASVCQRLLFCNINSDSPTNRINNPGKDAGLLLGVHHTFPACKLQAIPELHNSYCPVATGTFVLPQSLNPNLRTMSPK